MTDEKEKKDRIYLGPALAENTCPFIRKSADGTISGGIVSDDASKLPRVTGMLDLKRIKGNEFEVNEDIQMTSPYYAEDSPRSGPAKANNANFISGWDRIFGGSKTVGES